jgi:hypothetical protein
MKLGTRRSLAIGLMVVVALLASSVMPVDAGGRVFVGVGVGVPFWYPYPYVYPYPAYSPPVVVQSPPVYVQPQTAAPAPSQYWYYCQGAQAYYPYVRDCPGGWMEVVPQAAPAAPPQGPPAR